MDINEAGINLIKSFESCSLVCYKDAVGLNTIGWGHRTSLPVGATIDQAYADKLLRDDLNTFIGGVKSMVEIALNDNQFSALVSFSYNVGLENLKNSTLLKLVNQGDFEDAANEFQKWDHAGGKVLEGLLRRRLAEKLLFLS